MSEPYPEQPPPEDFDVADFFAKVTVHGIGGVHAAAPPGYRPLNDGSNVAVREVFDAAPTP